MYPQIRIPLLVVGLLLLPGFGATRLGRATAQDPRAAAERYVSLVILGTGDIPNFKPLTSSASGGTVVLAGRTSTFGPTAGNAAAGVTVKAFVFVDEESARRYHAELPTAASSRYTVKDHDVSARFTCAARAGIPMADEAILCTSRFTDHGHGFVAWRAGTVYFEISTAIYPEPSTESDTFRLANLQGLKMVQVGPFSPGAALTATPVPASPTAAPTATPTAPPGGGSPAMPAMQLLVVARVGGALAQDGTVIAALMNGRECGSAPLTLGFTVLEVASADGQPGCGTPGAPISFKIGDDAANESIVWGLDNLATPVSLTASRALVGGGLVVRPTLQVSCVPVGGECSPQERALWAGEREVWIADFRERGDEPTDGAMVRAWLRFRAQRGEVFGNLALALLDGRPFTFILAVRYGPTANEPEPYISLFNFGAERAVGGWSLRTSGDAVFTFPDGAVLSRGLCRIYANPLESPDSGPACGAAAFPPPGATLPSRGGYAELVDAQGSVVDSVGW
jgi:hypothetical protein